MRRAARTKSTPSPSFVAEIKPDAGHRGTLMFSGEFSSYLLEELTDTVRKGASSIKLSLFCASDHYASRIARAWLDDMSGGGAEVELVHL